MPLTHVTKAIPESERHQAVVNTLSPEETGAVTGRTQELA